MKKNAALVYGLLTLAWLGIVIWQIAEHRRVRNSIHEAQLNRAHDIANSLAVVIRSQRRFGTVPRNRLVGALQELAASRELLGIALLNPASEVLASGGQSINEDLAELTPGTVKRENGRLIVASLVELGTDRPVRGRSGTEPETEQPEAERPGTAVVWSPEDTVPPAAENRQESEQRELTSDEARAQNSYLRELNLAAAGLAHEPRNPLNIVRSITQLTVSDKQLGVPARQQLQKALEEVDRMTARLNEFIDYSKPREPHLSAVSPTVLAHDVAQTLETDFEDKKIEFTCPDEQVQILADAGMLRQVLFNLLLNAVQAASAGGKIEVRLRHHNDKAEMAVVDNGPGVQPEAREDIFRPYFTLSDFGSGLGLAVVRQVVFAHGWDISCEPNPDGGSIFRICEMEKVGNRAAHDSI